MKALVYTGPGRVQIQAVAKPTVQPGDALLEIQASGICGSDIHGFLGHSERRRPWQILGMDRVQGTYAQFVALPAACLYPLSKDLSEQEAVMVEPLANVVHFFRTTMAEMPDSLTILGAGPIG